MSTPQLLWAAASGFTVVILAWFGLLSLFVAALFGRRRHLREAAAAVGVALVFATVIPLIFAGVH